MLTKVHDVREGNDQTSAQRSSVDGIVRDSAPQMLAPALDAKVAACVEQLP